MKITISAVFSLLASTAVARPRATGEAETVPEKSRVTAFVISDDGTPSVECWEITNMIDEQQARRTDGSMGTARAMSLAGSRELEGVDILTWPSYSPIWPIADDDVRTGSFDLGASNNLFSIQGGLIVLNRNPSVNRKDDDDDDTSQYVFSLENGDDWFYFEDDYSGSSLAQNVDAAPPPFVISTISGGETEAIRLRFSNQPKHKVLHKGACSFTGISTPSPSSQRKSSHNKNPLVQQYGNSAL